MQKFVDQAIVIKRINYADSDRIVTILSQKYGLKTLFAKGARKQRSKLSGGIEPLSLSEFTWVKGKSNLSTLTGVKLINHYEKIVTDIKCSNQVFDVLKKIIKQIEDGEGRDYFPYLEIFLKKYEDDEFDSKSLYPWVILRIMSINGVLNELTVEDAKSAYSYNFDFEKQNFANNPQGIFSANEVKLIRLLARSKKPLRINENQDIDYEKVKDFVGKLYDLNLGN